MVIENIKFRKDYRPEDKFSVPWYEGDTKVSPRRHAGLVESHKYIVFIHAVHVGVLQTPHCSMESIPLLERKNSHSRDTQCNVSKVREIDEMGAFWEIRF